jgi:hypothetical protein
VDTFDEASPIHRRLAIKYQNENPWVSADGALLATQFESDRAQEESDRLDDEFRAMMDRLYPEFQKHHDEYARAIAEGRTPPVPGRRGEEPRHPSPTPPGSLDGLTPVEPGPALPALGLPGTGAARAAYGRISPRHGEAALRYLRQHECSWQEAVAATAEGG